MRPVLAALLCAPLLLSSPASAQVLDLSTIKCKEFVSANKETIGIILAWLDAYYKDEDAPPTIDFAQMEDAGKKLGAECGANPEMGLITVTDKLFEK